MVRLERCVRSERGELIENVEDTEPDDAKDRCVDGEAKPAETKRTASGDPRRDRGRESHTEFQLVFEDVSDGAVASELLQEDVK